LNFFFRHCIFTILQNASKANRFLLHLETKAVCF
jgi:hypothetical protein